LFSQETFTKTLFYHGNSLNMMRIRMRKSAALLLVLVLTASSIIAFLPVKAEARNIVVPDDYPTISAAIGNATDGDTIFVKKGTYEEKTLEIDKTLSLVGEGAEFTKINLDPPRYEVIQPPYYWGNQTISWFGSSITVDANYFKLQGFTISTPGTSDMAGGGISIAGNRTQILGNIIMTRLSVGGSYWNIAENTLLGDVGVNGSYSNIVENIVSGTIQGYGSYLNISFNSQGHIRLEGSFCIVYGNNAPSGIEVWGDGNTVAKNVVEHSVDGVKIDGSDNVVYANRITNNERGLVIDSRRSVSNLVEGSLSNTFFANYIANNLLGVAFFSYLGTNLTSIFYHNNLIDNTYQVNTKFSDCGNSYFDNGEKGNYWSDYTGTDVDGDGVGDTPYVIDDKRQDRYPLMAPFDIDSVQLDLSEWMSPPSVHLISPENTTYASANVALEFTVSKQTSWMGYSLNGEANITITENTTLLGLSYGSHNITVYAKDIVGRSGASETIYFSVAEPFPTMLVAVASAASAAAVAAVLLIYFKKRKR
jgi:nitrous oxidase accessory protein NosD